MKINSGIVGQAFASVSYYLSKREKWQAGVISILLLVASVLDVFGLASLVPVLLAASEPEEVSKNKYLGFIYLTLGFENERFFFLSLILFFFLFFLLKNIFTTWINYKQVTFTAAITLKIITNQYKKLTNLPFWQFNKEGSAKLINNIIDIPFLYKTNVIRSLFLLFSEVIVVLLFTLIIIFYQPYLFLLLLIILLPASVLIYKLLKSTSEKVGKNLNQLRPTSYSILANTFNGFVEIRLNEKSSAFFNIFSNNQEKVEELEAKKYLFSLVPLKAIEMIALLSITSIFLYIFFLEKNANNLIAIVGLFAAAAYRLMPSINRILNALISLKQASVAIEQLQQFQEYDYSHQPAVNVNSSLSFNTDITFKNITFSFPDSLKSTLNNINITVKKGGKIGLIGASGSGKTTLMNLLLRLYEEQKGAILVDGVPLTEVNKNSWYKIVGYVKQDVFLLEGTIKDNVTLLDPDPDLSRLEYSLQKASLSDFINQLPEGVNTTIGEKGFKLSGGQKQRIGIARALYKNAQVLVLDEATSALDSETEKEVTDAIANLSATDITIFIIAHRVTTLRSADRIFEMKDGSITNELSYKDINEKITII